MTEVWLRAALWLGLAATLISIRLRIATALSEIVVGTVAQLLPTEVETQAAIELATIHYEKLFESLRRQAQERQVELRTHVLVGHPADQILTTAAAQAVDLIVVGHRGRSAIREWVTGSTSRRIFTHAKCPVLVVRAR
jgi:nucleotide-binding universal stress UspA family protein